MRASSTGDKNPGLLKEVHAIRYASLLVLLSALGWCQTTQAANPNVLLLIADDLGVDQVGAYRGQTRASLTPRIDQVANEGLLFRNAWSNPIRSPTRATMLTGRYSFRTGVGWITAPHTNDAYAISPNEFTLPIALTTLGVASANIGKWHLGNGDLGPNTLGFQYCPGWTEGKLPDYHSCTKIINGEPSAVRNNATTETVDDALA